MQRMYQDDLESRDSDGGIPDDLKQELEERVRAYYDKDNIDNNDTNRRTPQPWSYYQRMKKEKKWTYYPPSVEKQMMEDYKALGDRFEDGSFNQ